MMTIVTLILTYVAPGLLAGGIIGHVGAILETPAAGIVIAAAKKVARGEHLSDEEARLAEEYRLERSAQDVMHGLR